MTECLLPVIILYLVLSLSLIYTNTVHTVCELFTQTTQLVEKLFGEKRIFYCYYCGIHTVLTYFLWTYEYLQISMGFRKKMEFLSMPMLIPIMFTIVFLKSLCVWAQQEKKISSTKLVEYVPIVWEECMFTVKQWRNFASLQTLARMFPLYSLHQLLSYLPSFVFVFILNTMHWSTLSLISVCMIFPGMSETNVYATINDNKRRNWLKLTI